MLLLQKALELLRQIAVRLLAVYFRIVPIPQSLRDKTTDASNSNLKDLCIITESGSLIIEGLLFSFSRRLNLKSAVNLGRHPEQRSQFDTLNWCSLHAINSLDTLLSTTPYINFATLNIFSGRGPFKNNPSYKLGFWDLSGIIILGKFLIIFLGKELDIESLNIRNISSLIRSLRLDFYKNHKLVRGTPFQTIEVQERVVVGGSEFMQEIEILSKQLAIPKEELQRKARKAFYEIAANPRRPMYRIIAFSANFIINRLFETVKTDGLDLLKQSIRDSTVVLVPMHRSHLDYILLGSELYKAGFNPPLVAAGINLSFWPAGSMIRSVGAYFVKRNVKTDKLHALILKRYVSYLTRRGHLQEFFIEGGRSRSGRMRRPKLGLLNIFHDAYLKGYKKDILFMPVSVTYENVIEDATYGTENTGRSKQKENFWALLKAGRIFGRSYGDVMINFGEALSLREYVEAQKTQFNVSTPAMTDFGLQITRAIRDQINPSLTCLLHTALLISPHYGMQKNDLINCIKNLGRLLEYVKKITPHMGSYTPSLKNFLNEPHPSVADFTRSKTIQVKPYMGEEVFYLPGAIRFTADFYKNTLIHLFVPLGFFSLLDLLKLDINQENIAQLHNIFAYDYMLEERQAFIIKCLNLREDLVEAKILTSKNDKVAFLEYSNGIFMPSLLLPSIQSLVWAKHVIIFLIQQGSTQVEDNAIDKNSIVISYDAAMQHMIHEFRTAVYLGQMSCTEASSSSALSSAMECLVNLGIIEIKKQSEKQKIIIVKDPIFKSLELIENANNAITLWQNSNKKS